MFQFLVVLVGKTYLSVGSSIVKVEANAAPTSPDAQCKHHDVSKTGLSQEGWSDRLYLPSSSRVGAS